MELILRWFWLLAAGVMLLNAAIWRRRLARMERAGGASGDDIARFLRVFCVGVLFATLLLLVIQLAAGWSTPLCAQLLPLRDPWVLASQGVTLALWLATLVWVWQGDGAELISRLSPGLGRRYPGRGISPRAVRLGVPALLLLCALGPVLARRSPPPPAAVARAGCVAAADRAP